MTEKNMAAIRAAALALVRQAELAGVVVTIETVPKVPLAMRNYRMEVDVRAVRGPGGRAVTVAEGLSEEAAGMLEQAASMLEALACDERGRGNDSAAMGAECSAVAVRGLAFELVEAQAECKRLDALINTPQTSVFLSAVAGEKAHQIERWGNAHDRSKSAEHWFWLVGYLAGKALRASITGDLHKALHHTISSAAALANWHDAITADSSGAGVGQDYDLRAHDAPTVGGAT